jgi:murein DD-endopeptidase MepM/ murein hydrolase activator NlpD
VLALILSVVLAAPAPARFDRPAAIQPISAPVIESAAPRSPFDAARAGGQATPQRAEGVSNYPIYAWPLERQLRDGLLVVNYMDHDPTSNLLDYSSGTHTYDGHTGTDIALYDFRAMDRGCRVLAAAPGTVTQVSTPTPFDRHCDFNWPDDGNWVEVTNADGTYTYYLHLRRSSTAVQVGDAIQTGHTIGLVGSSGYSTAPHLHFEPGEYNGTYTARDPFNGPSNPLPSLWASQTDYAGDDVLWFSRISVFTEAQVGGSVFNTSYCDVQNGLFTPPQYGANEDHLPILVQLQGRQGDPGRIEVRKPDGSLWAFYDFTLDHKAQFDWMWLYYFWNGNIAPADYGTWSVRAYSGATLSASSNFTVGASTIYGARLFPKRGRSFRIDGTVQRDTLRRHPITPALTYALLNAPGFVTLQDSVVSVGTTSPQTTRNLYFQVVASDGAARRDTAFYHVVDFSKPLETQVGVAASIFPLRSLHVRLVSVNPGSGPALLEFSNDTMAGARLTIVDAAGRRVRRLFDGVLGFEPRQTTWDGRDDSGARVRQGLYFAVLEDQNGNEPPQVARIIRLQ